MTGEVLRLRLLLVGVALAGVSVMGLPAFRPVTGGPVGVAIGLAVGLGVFLLLAGAPRVPANRRGLLVGVGCLVAGATLEELFWRGLVLGALVPPVGAAAALVITTVGFAISHVRVFGRRCSVHLATGTGFGAAFLVAGLPAAVAAHAGYNVLVDLGVRAGPEHGERP